MCYHTVPEEDIHKYISVYGLRAHGEVGGKPVSQCLLKKVASLHCSGISSQRHLIKWGLFPLHKYMFMFEMRCPPHMYQGVWLASFLSIYSRSTCNIFYLVLRLEWEALHVVYKLCRYLRLPMFTVSYWLLMTVSLSLDLVSFMIHVLVPWEEV